MADRSLRGMRLGAQSLQSEEGVTFSPRTQYEYKCTTCGKVSDVVFSSEAEAPQTWECKHCGEEAILLVNSEPVVLDRPDAKVPRSHWDMLLERRTRAELEELLEERLTYLRTRRGKQVDGKAKPSSSTDKADKSDKDKTDKDKTGKDKTDKDKSGTGKTGTDKTDAADKADSKASVKKDAAKNATVGA